MSNNNLETVAAPTKFTKEIKENWLAALKSGKYVQGTGQLEYTSPKGTQFCCIGVLGHVTEGLNNQADYIVASENPWSFLEEALGVALIDTIWKTNDGHLEPEKKNLGNFLNVIPLVEALPTQD